MGDLENGLWGGNQRYNPNLASVDFDYVTAMLKGGANNFAIKFGNANAANLTVGYDGPRPEHYQPMKKQGAILLGIVREIFSDSSMPSARSGPVHERECIQCNLSMVFLTWQPSRAPQGGDNSDSAIGTFFEVRCSAHQRCVSDKPRTLPVLNALP